MHHLSKSKKLVQVIFFVSELKQYAICQAAVNGVIFLPKATIYCLIGQNGDIKSPKRLCTDYRSILVERNTFASPVKDRLLAFGNVKSKMLPPPLQSAFAR